VSFGDESRVTVEEVIAQLNAKKNGVGYKAKCPAHDDHEPSLSIGSGEDGRVLLHCHAGCELDAICAAMNIEPGDLFPKREVPRREPTTIARLAAHKKLDVVFLRELGLRDLTDGGVGIPYRDIDGAERVVKRRTALVAKEGSFWPRGKPLLPYGLDRISDAREVDRLIIVEGESDCWTLWHHEIPALGMPGASSTRALEIEHVAGIAAVYVMREPDSGGEKFVAGIARRLAEVGYQGRAFEIRLDGAKDPSELHIQNATTFKERLERAISAARLLGARGEEAQRMATRPASEIEMKPVEWLWRRRIPLGMLSMFDGDPGLCKSTVIADLAAHGSRGDPLPGDRESIGKWSSILISFEDTSAHIIAPRLEAAGADRSQVHIWQLDDVGFNLVDGLVDLEAQIKATGARWVVIDPLMAAMPSALNAHRDQDVRGVLAPLAKLAERAGCAITFVRHLNKSGGGNALYRGGGSIGIIGAARSGLLLGRDPDDRDEGARVLAMSKYNVGKAAPALKLRVVSAPPPAPGIDVARIIWEGESERSADELVTSEVEREEAGEAEAWLKSLLECGPQPADEIKKQSRANGLAWRTVERAKKNIGAVSKRRGFGVGGAWEWKLPGYDHETCGAP